MKSQNAAYIGQIFREGYLLYVPQNLAAGFLRQTKTASLDKLSGFLLNYEKWICGQCASAARSTEFRSFCVRFMSARIWKGKIMSRYSKEDILRMVEEEDVGFIRLQFTDVFGTMKNIAVTAGQLECALNNECSFDGSGIDGFVRIEEEDMFLYPDFDSFRIFPWRPQTGKVARLICDIKKGDGAPFEGDSRYVLKKVLQDAADMGYYLYIAPECEFCLFPCDSDGEVTLETKGHGSYFDVAPLDDGEDVRRDIILTLEEMGIDVKNSYHEYSPYQHEIDLQPLNALTAADNIITFRMVCKNIANRHGLYATFMPKPKNDSDGCGMHLNMTLMDADGNNILSDSSDSYGLSKIGYSFMAGIMAHIKGMAAVTNPLVNSYKRIVPGNEAPAYIAWSSGNRSPLISVPKTNGDTHIKLRNPDPCVNPYLAFAAIMAAGLEGIKKGLKPPKATEHNICRLSEEECHRLHLKRLPVNLSQALDEMSKDSLMQETFGEYLFGKYIRAKKREVSSFQSFVTDWETEEYLKKY